MSDQACKPLSPVVRGRCRDGLPNERDKTAWKSGLGRAGRGFFIGLGFRRRFKSSRPDLFAYQAYRRVRR